MSDPDAGLPPPEVMPEDMVVGIGASAGGLKALLAFFAEVKPHAGIAYVVVPHLSPEHESNVPQLIQSTASIPVTAVTDRTPIRPDHAYVVSPKNELVIVDEHLEPVVRKRSGPTFSIDRLFETLGTSHRHRAACIVLSGTGSDGTLGVKAIKANGGVTFAQAPEDAEYDAMPRSAIASGVVDFVMPAAQMPAKLASIWRNAKVISLPPLEDKPTPEDVAAKAEDALRDVLSLVRAKTGHDFSQYKRSTLLRRVERRLQVVQVQDLPGYRDFVRAHPEESAALLRDVLISVTSFFRDPAAFQALENRVIPALFEGRGEGARVRVWVAGCASGEEAYSIAMLLAEHAHRTTSTAEINLFATDIDEDALAQARTALYPESIKEQLSAERLRRFFVKDGSHYRVQKSLREMVMFATHNVIQDPPFSKIDLISCRNLLIYLNHHVQGKVLDLLHFALRADGYLFLGLSETVDDDHDGFVVVDKQARIFQQQPRARVGMLLTALPTIGPIRVPPDLAPVGRRLVSFAELHQNLLEHYAPPSLVVDERFDVVHVSENAGKFLHIAGGEPSLSLLKIVPEELRFELRSMLETAVQSMRTVERVGLPMQRGPQLTHLSIKVHPVRERATARTFALVIFDESINGDVLELRPVAADEERVASRLEERLQNTQAQLRAALEQYEIQNEELKASNEELQATNEELRATSEELETGKEELQSINEELTTVNQELKNKVDETTRISDDLQNFMSSTEIAVLFVDRQFRLMRFTPFAREIFNVIGPDVGRPLLDITHRLVDANLETDIESVFTTLRVVEREVRASTGRWYILRILPYRTKEDRIGGAVLTFIDITQRKEAEDATKRSRSWLQVIVDSVADYAILTVSPDGRIESWNRGAEKMLGYTAAEAIGQPFGMIFLPEDRAAGTPENELRTAYQAGRAEDERWQLRKDGSRFFASGVTAPLHEGQTHGYVKIIRDLTEHQLATERRDEAFKHERESRAAAEEANRLKDEFLATLSHELRNPLALGIMQSEYLLRSPELRKTPKLAGAVETIHQMLRAQSQFVDDMLDVSRARTGKLSLQRQILPLALIIADSIGALRDEADRNGITLEVAVTNEPLIVEADPVRVKQIVWNLLSNAIKFTPRGGRVTVEVTRDSDMARLVVEDTGQGIASEMLPQIFDWFRQAETGRTRRREGMGIGLALVKQLVELHGGRVHAESQGTGKGARFIVCLPLQRTETAHGLPPPPQPIAAGERLRGLRLLIIDDAPANAEILRELLELEGADAMIETSAHDAITRARNHQFDVIISDLAMPGMDGYTMLRKLQASPRNGKTRAIAYSGFGGPEEEARSRKAGFDVHLTKPADLDQLVDAITSLQERRKAK